MIFPRKRLKSINRLKIFNGLNRAEIFLEDEKERAICIRSIGMYTARGKRWKTFYPRKRQTERIK